MPVPAVGVPVSATPVVLELAVTKPVKIGLLMMSMLILRVIPALTVMFPLPPLSGAKSTV